MLLLLFRFYVTDSLFYQGLGRLPSCQGLVSADVIVTLNFGHSVLDILSQTVDPQLVDIHSQTADKYGHSVVDIFPQTVDTQLVDTHSQTADSVVDILYQTAEFCCGNPFSDCGHSACGYPFSDCGHSVVGILSQTAEFCCGHPFSDCGILLRNPFSDCGHSACGYPFSDCEYSFSNCGHSVS
ncbi:hypothetical protein SK128_006863, partial [Halocaridina rubra]